MNELYPIAKLGEATLFINEADLSKVGNEQSLEIKTIKVQLNSGEVEPVGLLEEYLKFGPWQETSAVERLLILQELSHRFSERQILEKIILPLLTGIVR